MRPLGFVPRLLVVCVLLASTGLASIASAKAALMLLDGTLVQAQGDSKVYFIQNAQKRWVTSEQAFHAQGFLWSEIRTVDPQSLHEVVNGADIGTIVEPGLVLDRSLLPDLAPVAPYDIRFSVENGQTRLRFTSTFWNRGKGAFELNAGEDERTTDGEFDATQKLLRADGSIQHRPVGTLFWHNVHQHYHFDEFGTYLLEMVRPSSIPTAATPVVTTKTTFCMRDDERIGAPSEGLKQPRAYTGCSGKQQGVSIGWADVYRSTLPDQYVDVTGLPAGIYRLIFNVDPQGRFAEIRRDNNVSMTFMELDPAKRTLRVIGTTSPYESPNNRFPDGTLIRSESDPTLYVVEHNKKRLIRNEAVLQSYGLSREAAYVIPQRAIDVFPSETLIRVKGTAAVYTLNVAGFKRRILNPEILMSYRTAGMTITDINQTEFDSLPYTDLIARIDDDRVYAMSSKRFVGTFETLRSIGLDSNSVHGLNELDFQAYAISSVATGLNVPWDLVFLPDGDLLVTERSGTVRRLGKQTTVISIPSVSKLGEGGLMGIALHPNFVQNQFVYLYFTSSEDGTHNRIARFRLEGNELVQDRIIVDNIPAAIYHDGGQLAFGPDGMLYATIGDANDGANAQNLSTFAGKTLRFTPEGGIPSDNPFGTAVWSYGHRNAQGIAWDSAGRQWQTEHGRSGALSGLDELNLIEKGKNYGWPTIQGDDVQPGMQRPALHSGANTTWAPSGMAYVSGNLFFAGLRGESLYKATVSADGNITKLTSHLVGQYGRLRAVVSAPDGSLYLTTSNRDGRGTPRAGDDKIIRVYPELLQ